MDIGRRHWAIAEGWIPPYSQGPEPAMTSHETSDGIPVIRQIRRTVSSSSPQSGEQIAALQKMTHIPRSIRACLLECGDVSPLF